MIGGFSNRCPDGIRINGVDHGGPGKIITENPGFIAIKWPAHKYWVGRGMDQEYGSPEMAVCQKIKKNGSEYLEPIITWKVTRKKQNES